MKKTAFLLCATLFCFSCSQVQPFVDSRREAGLPNKIGRSTPDYPVICYNGLWSDLDQAQALADLECEKTGRKALFQDETVFSCKLLTPKAARFMCVHSEKEPETKNN